MLPISLLYPATDDFVAFVEADGDKARKRFSPVRNDPWRNQHSIRYISEYASKSETISNSYYAALNDFCARGRPSLAWGQIRRLQSDVCESERSYRLTACSRETKLLLTTTTTTTTLSNT